ncbi:MAG: hypothetical protein AB1467_06245 [Candidatus Diapherotrites archaeon]
MGFIFILFFGLGHAVYSLVDNGSFEEGCKPNSEFNNCLIENSDPIDWSYSSTIDGCRFYVASDTKGYISSTKCNGFHTHGTYCWTSLPYWNAPASCEYWSDYFKLEEGGILLFDLNVQAMTDCNQCIGHIGLSIGTIANQDMNTYYCQNYEQVFYNEKIIVVFWSNINSIIGYGVHSANRTSCIN